MAEINEELNELKENAEHAAGDPKLAPVSFTMAVLAVVLATITLLGHRAHTHEVVLQTKANDQWGFYQGNAIRRSTDEMFAKLMSSMDFKDREKAEQTRKWFESEAERHRAKVEEIMKEAKAFEAEAQHEQRLANRFDLGEGFVEVALVVTSITLLTRRRHYWFVGGLIAILGIAVAVSAAFVH